MSIKIHTVKIYYSFILIAIISTFFTSCRGSLNITDFPSQFKSGEHNLSIYHDGRTRTFILHLPPQYNERTPLPMIIIFHGGGGNADGALDMTLMREKSDKEGFIALAPNGTGRFENKLLTWNTGNCCGYAFENNVDDAGFIRTLIDTLQQVVNIDAARIYATGISNGGMMSYLVGCKLPDKIAAIAPVAGAMNFDCTSSNPLSVIIFHGTGDEHVLYYGGESPKQIGKNKRIDKPVSYAVNFWVKNNGCDTIPVKEEMSNIIKETYSHGKNNTDVTLYTIKNGTHSWPGGKRGWFGGDKPTEEINATDLIWEFFKNVHI
ncbi:MAG: polyhydroxybutyrate depolymerase [Ignavibacteriae bacterium]|nr:MAG: polyhydroxybutyrate depolymerase [Ignavibacteriota bacterium]